MCARVVSSNFCLFLSLVLCFYLGGWTRDERETGQGGIREKKYM